MSNRSTEDPIPSSEIRVPRKRGIHGVIGIKNLIQVQFRIPEISKKDVGYYLFGGVALISACATIENNLHVFQWLKQFIGR